VTAEFVRKTDSTLMRVISWVLPRQFMLHYWTTIGSTIYVPTKYDEDKDWGSLAWRARHIEVIRHEHVHVEQFATLGLAVMALLYIGPILITLPIAVLFYGVWWLWAIAGLSLLGSFGFAWGRWFVERTAYLVQVKTPEDVEWAVSVLWSFYGWCWPKAWMRRWFKERL
jgi:hypothetical protein